MPPALVLQSLQIEQLEKNYSNHLGHVQKNDDGDTREVLEKCRRLRLQKPIKKNFAEWKIQDQMAQTKRAMNLCKIAAPVAKSKVEAKEIQNLIDGQNGGFKLEPWIGILLRASA
jgi:peptidyl-dipeptidase Dcp